MAQAARTLRVSRPRPARPAAARGLPRTGARGTFPPSVKESSKIAALRGTDLRGHSKQTGKIKTLLRELRIESLRRSLRIRNHAKQNLICDSVRFSLVAERNLNGLVLSSLRR